MVVYGVFTKDGAKLANVFKKREDAYKYVQLQILYNPEITHDYFVVTPIAVW